MPSTPSHHCLCLHILRITYLYIKKWRITISSAYIFSYLCIAKYNHYKNHTKNL